MDIKLHTLLEAVSYFRDKNSTGRNSILINSNEKELILVAIDGGKLIELHYQYNNDNPFTRNINNEFIDGEKIKELLKILKDTNDNSIIEKYITTEYFSFPDYKKIMDFDEIMQMDSLEENCIISASRLYTIFKAINILNKNFNKYKSLHVQFIIAKTKWTSYTKPMEGPVFIKSCGFTMKKEEQCPIQFVISCMPLESYN